MNGNLYQVKATIDYEGDIPYLTVMGKRFVCMVEPNLTIGMMQSKISDDYIQPDKSVRYLYVTVNASPKMLEIAKHPDLNILDCAGNYNIQYLHDNGEVALMLANKGEKRIEDPKAKAYPIFLDKGLRVICYLLQDKSNVRAPYRTIMDMTEVAIGTVKNTIDGMIYQQFIRVENNKRFLANTERLLQLWAYNYGQSLKPKLLQSRFAFRNDEKRRKWATTELPDGMYWGGEPAAALTDGYITPGEFTIYTEVAAATLMKTGAVIPDAEGEITVYQKFWKGGDAKTVPAVLIYADLIDSTNSRCIEAAQKIKENELKYLR